MKYLLGYKSSFEFWQYHDLYEVTRPSRTALRFTDPASIRNLQKIGFPAQTTVPAHVILHDRNALRQSSEIRSHFELRPIGNACVRFNKNVFISTPEATFLQLAHTEGFLKLLMIGYELCGTYATLETGRLAIREPRSSVRKIQSHLNRRQQAHGLTLARKVAAHIVDGAASPMEAKLTLMLCLPATYGGYGLPQPQLNIPISANGRNFKCDLCWPISNLVLEYDSDLYHTGESKLHRDSARRTALEAAGLHVISVTRAQLNNCLLLDEVAYVVRKRLGIRRSTTRKDAVERRLRLHAALLGRPLPGGWN